MSENIPLFPVSAWSVGPIDSYGAVTIKFDFLTHPMQSLDEANQGRHYLLMPVQAAELAQKIQQALRHLETVAPQAPPGSQH